MRTLAVAFLLCTASTAQDLAVKGGVVHTMSSAPARGVAMNSMPH